MIKTILVKNIKKNSVKLNQFALESTEKVILTSIDKVEDLQELTSKTLKSTLDFLKNNKTIFSIILKMERK